VLTGPPQELYGELEEMEEQLVLPARFLWARAGAEEACAGEAEQPGGQGSPGQGSPGGHL